jgi:tRNA (cytidine/uridine-2'-O-)-methyltransferase
MLHVALYQPEIPPNTGNIIRLCANAGVTLHLIHPLGFELSEARVKRAGLDYREMTCVVEHADLDSFIKNVLPVRLYAVSTRGQHRYADVKFQSGDAVLFGPETRGLPQALLDSLPPDRVVRNLSNAVAVIVYEAWRQNNFAGGK